MKLSDIHPVSGILHATISYMLSNLGTKTVLDVGGKYKMNEFMYCKVDNANIIDGFDGCNLPFKDNSYEAVISIATVEHVHNPERFMSEAVRVAKKISIHWMPWGKYAEYTEDLKQKYGHRHSCKVPIILFEEYTKYPYITCGEHLLLCMTITKTLRTLEIYQWIVDHYKCPYGYIFKWEV